MATQPVEIDVRRENDNGSPTVPDRERLMRGIPVVERRLELAGVSTAVLEGGQGPPIVLLHGPGEFAGKWVRVLPALLASHRVVAPDLPDHGASAAGGSPLDAERLLAWLDQLIEQCCPEPPTLVGHVLGGAIAARYAVANGEKLDRLVLVDTLGLARFRPAPRFAFTMVRFLRNPNERTYDRFMRQCSLDLDELREGMGERWDPFASYNVDLARSPRAKAAGALMREVGLPRIPAADLARITVPTNLIWGREDRANRIAIAERASARYGWPLQTIDDCADDPARDRPEAFVEALESAIAGTSAG
ncbi:MAG: alpha/beta hydrolase [Solirubrobacterales bacterium]